MPISFCAVCKKRQGTVSSTHRNCGGEEAFCTCTAQELEPELAQDEDVEESPPSPTAHSQYVSSQEEEFPEFDDADWLRAAAASLVDDSLPPPTPVKLSDQMLTQHRSVIAKVDTAFKQVGVHDVFARVLNANLAGGNAKQMVLAANIHEHQDKVKFLQKKLLPVFAKNQKGKFQAAQWANGCYRTHPTDCFVPDAADRLAAWSGSTAQMRTGYLQEMVSARNQDTLTAAMNKYNSEWVLMWARKFVLAQELKHRENELMMTPEKITSYFNKCSPAARGIKRKAIFITLDE